MSDTLIEIGELSLLDLMPGVLGPLMAAEADLQARITALLGFSATVGLDMGGLITLSAGILANLQAALALGVTPPSLTFQINLVVSLTATLRLQLKLISDLLALLAASVHAYAYDGTCAGFGTSLTAALSAGLPGGSGPTQHIDALVFATAVPAAWAAIAQVFRTSP